MDESNLVICCCCDATHSDGNCNTIHFAGNNTEMFAYCLAAAHLNLPHQIVQSFMVSDAGAGGMEGWKHSLDKYSELDMCTEGAIPLEDLPNVLHYCKLVGDVLSSECIES